MINALVKTQHTSPMLIQGPMDVDELTTGHIISVRLCVNENTWPHVLKLDRWSLPLLWHSFDLSIVCNFWPQLKFLGQLLPVTRPSGAPASSLRIL